ncbi:MAG: BspA family leucine-rich repeat surface protein, partial [Oscillospiraceae bacterium]|nr:BspA family leucine-rich repeat surface protein [Oscillospiraceae bacterium]
MKMKTKRVLAFVLSLVICFSAVPNTVLFAATETVDDSTQITETAAKPAGNVSLDGIDFSSRRLLVATNNASIFKEDEQVLSEYDGIYILAFADEAQTKEAYKYYYGIADFVEPDRTVYIAGDDYTDASGSDFSDSVSDAFTQLNLLLGIDKTMEDGKIPNPDNTEPSSKKVFSNKSKYDVAIIDTGAANGEVDFVSVIGGDGVDDNGHGTAMLGTVKSIRDKTSVLSIKAFDSRGVGRLSGIYAAVSYAVKQGVNVISLSFDAKSAEGSVVFDRAVSMAKNAGITVVGVESNTDTDVIDSLSDSSKGGYVAEDTDENGAKLSALIAAYGVDDAITEINEGDIFGNNDDEYNLMSTGESADHPLLQISELEKETAAAVNSASVATIAGETDDNTDWSVPPTQQPVTVDNTTIERLLVRWLSKSDGEEKPAYFGRLNLDPKPETDIVTNQQFQIDFALSGQQTHQPGTVELTFPARIWTDRKNKEAGELVLSIPEDPEKGVEFVWKRVNDTIVITNAKPLAAASKVMIQGTFRNLVAHEMVDGTTSDKFYANLTVSTPQNKTVTMKSNEIDAQIDTEVHVTYANKTAYNSVSGTYDVWWMSVPDSIPPELLPENKDDYAYVRWYVAGTAEGNQPYKMYVEDAIALDSAGKPEYDGILLGVSDIAADKNDSGVKTSSNGAYYKKAENNYVKALLYDGYSAIVKSAYVWTAYPKSSIPEEKTTLNNMQTIYVTGWDDNIETHRSASATVETKAPTTYTFVKHWSDIVIDENTGEYVDNYWKLRPDEMILRIYWKEYSSFAPWKSILLTADNSDDKTSEYPNDWKYEWSDEGHVKTFNVGESIDESKRKGVFETRYDDSGHQLEWQYVLRGTEYDEDNHIWTYDNEYDDGWIKYELSTITKDVEYKYSDSKLDSMRDDLSLNKLLRNQDVYVTYPVEATTSVAKQAVAHSIYPNRFVLEDEEYILNQNRKLTVNDIDISEVTFGAPVVYKYTTYDEDGYYSRAVIDTPPTTLYGEIDGNWIELAKLVDGVVTESNGASVEKVEEGWKVTMPEGKLVAHVKQEFDNPDDEVVTMTDMNFDVVLHVKPTETVKNIIETEFGENDFVMLPLYNKARGYAIYLGDETKREEDEYGDTREYKKGDTVTSMEATATGYLHGRRYRVAPELEKSFTYGDADIDAVNKRVTLHTNLKLTQQSNVTSKSDYDYAIKMGELPNTNSGRYYDLLPAGVEPITGTVKAGGSDSVKKVWTVPNYKGSGRTLLIAEVNLVDNISYTAEQKYSGDNNKGMAEHYPEKGYKNTHTLTFESYSSYDDIVSNKTRYMRNVAAYEASEGEIGNVVEWIGEPDDPTADNHIQSENAVGSEAIDWMTDLNQDGNPEGEPHAFVYAGAPVDFSGINVFATTSLEKQVSITGSGEWSKGENNDVNVQEGGLYSYRMVISSESDTSTYDIILFDKIEQYNPNTEGEDADRDDYGDNKWHGSLLSIDLSQVESKGVKPVVYYSTAADQDVSRAHYKPGNIGSTERTKELLKTDEDSEGNKIWTTEKPKDLSTVTAIAIDMTQSKDNKSFVLNSNEELIVYLNMRAPYDKDNPQPEYFKNKDNQYTVGKDRENPDNNAHAYNDIYLNCIQRVDGEDVWDYIYNSYTKVGIYSKDVEIKKVWDDGNNADGKRPGSITVTLKDNDGKIVEVMDSNGNWVKSIELNNENQWSATVGRLLTYDEKGNFINYTFEEEFADGFKKTDYTLNVERKVAEDGSITYVLNNSYEPEKISIPVTKTWQDNDSSQRPAYITVNLYANGKLVKSLKLTADNNWKGVFEDLNKYYDGGKEITYTIEEEPVNNYVPETTGDRDNGFKITNQYYPYGSLSVTKRIDDKTDTASDKNVFTFTLTLKTPDGGDVIDKYNYIIYDKDGKATDRTGKIGNGGEFTLKDGEKIVIKDIPTHILYTVTETDQTAFEISDVVNDSGEIISWPDAEVDFTNLYTTKGPSTIEALKKLSGRKILRYQFNFELYEKKLIDGSWTDWTLLRSVYNDKDGKVSFGNINYTNKDDGQTFGYKIVEKNDGKSGYTYDDTVYYAKVTPTDNGDGTMKCDVTYYSDEAMENELEDGEVPLFANSYSAKGSISLRAWKVLNGRTFNANDFTFNLYDKDFNLISSAKNIEGGRIDFAKINYTEKDAGNIYWYYAREVKGNNSELVYDESVIAYRVEVVDNGDGTLSFNQTAYYVTDALEKCEACGGTGKVDDADCDECNGFGYTLNTDWEVPESGIVPTFTNGLEDGSLSISKYAKGGTDPNQKFRFKIKLTGDKIEDKEIRYKVTNAASSEFPLSYGMNSMADVWSVGGSIAKFSTLNVAGETDGDYSVMPMADDDGYTTTAGIEWNIVDNTLIIRPAANPAEGYEPGLLPNISSSSSSSAPWSSRRNDFTAVEIQGSVKANQYADNLFANCSALESVDGLKNLDVSNVTHMQYMFQNCTGLKSLSGLENWDVGKVQSMTGMFKGCTGLTDVNLTGWTPTEALQTIVSIFEECTSLSYINLSGWGKGLSSKINASNAVKNCDLHALYLKDWGYTVNGTSTSGLLSRKKLSEIQFSEAAFDIFIAIPDAPGEPDSRGTTWVLLDDLIEKGEGNITDVYSGDDLRKNKALHHNNIYVWEASYQIAFEKGEGDVAGGMGNATYAPVYGSFDLPKSGFIRNGYVFTGWQDKDDSSKTYNLVNGVATIPERKYTRGQTVTLVPIWSEAPTQTAQMTSGEFTIELAADEKATIEGIPAGTAYQIWEETPNGWILVQQKNASGVIEPLKESKAEFYNLYQTAKTTAIIYGIKLLDNKAAATDANGNAFKFELRDAAGSVIETVSATDGGFIQFTPIEYTSDDAGQTFTYTVREVDGSNSKITYDSRVWTVTVSVTETNGVLGTTVTYTDENGEGYGNIEFKNYTRPGALAISKLVDGVPGDSDTIFNFRVKLTNENGMPLSDGSFDWYIKDADGNIISKNGETVNPDEQLMNLLSSYEADEAAAEEESDIQLFAVTAADKYGTVNWSIEDGTLTLEPASGSTGVLPDTTSYTAVPWYKYRTQIKKIDVKPGVKTSQNASYLFYTFNNLETLGGLENLDVSDTTSMLRMFSGCTKITDLSGISGWNVGNVTDMSGMFLNCSKLSDLSGISGWTVGNVTNMSSMFSSCKALTSISDLAAWNLSSVTNMSGMFQSCSFTALNGFEVWNNKLGSVENIGMMFNNCSNLTNLDGISGWNVRNVKDMNNIFASCGNLSDISGISGWDVSNVENMQNMFNNCKLLTSLDGLEGWNDKLGSVTNMSNMFNNCSNLTDLDGISGWDVSNVKEMNMMFYNCKDNGTYDSSIGATVYHGLTSIAALKDWKLNSVTNVTQMFGNCRALKYIGELGDWFEYHTGAPINMGQMFFYCEELDSVDGLKNWTVSDATGMREMFANCSGLVSLAGVSDWDVSNVTTMESMFNNCAKSVGTYPNYTYVGLSSLAGLEKWDVSNVTTMKSMFSGCKILDDITALENWDVSNVTTMEGMFSSCAQSVGGSYPNYIYIGLSSLAGLEKWDVSSVTNMSSMFHSCGALADISGISDWDVSNVINMQSTFASCSAITDLSGISDWDVSSVKNMAYTFQSCRGLTDFTDIANWDVSDVTDLTGTFQSCSSIPSLEGLENWDVSSVTKMYVTFQSCQSLTDLTALAKWDVSHVKDMHYTFAGCSTSSAPYSGLSSLEGLENWDTGSVETMYRMFAECRALKTLDSLANWDVSNVTTMEEMFYQCNTLEKLDGLKNWDVSNVWNMKKMFRECGTNNGDGIKSLAGLENWNVSNVTIMESMFQACKALESIEALRDWNIGAVNMRQMFEQCSWSEVIDGVAVFHGLKSLAGADNWDVSNVTDLTDIFKNCHTLIDADLSKWTPSVNVSVPSSVLYTASHLEKVYLDNWTYTGTVSKFWIDNSANGISEIRFSEDAFRHFQLDEPKQDKKQSTGKWVKKEDLTKGPNAEPTFTSEQLNIMVEGVTPGETYVWQAYYPITFELGDNVSGGRIQEYGSANYDYEIVGTYEAFGNLRFVGWEDQDGNVYNVIDGVATIPAGTYKHDQPVTLTAKWIEYDPNATGTYCVDHYWQDISSDSYTLAETTTHTAIPGNTVDAPIGSYDNLISPTEAKKVIVSPANWGEAPHVAYYYDRERYTVHFEGNGADGGKMNDRQLARGIYQTLGNSFTKSGYAFLGWSTEKNGSVVYKSSDSVINLAETGGTVTLYAQWYKVDRTVESTLGEFTVSCKAGETIVIEGLPAGTSYKIEEVDVPYGWTMVDKSNVSGTIRSGKVSQSSVTNLYSSSGTASITAHKMLEGANLLSGMFSFELWKVPSLDEEEPVLIETVSNGTVDEVEESVEYVDGKTVTSKNPWYGTAPVVFSPLDFTKTGEYKYFIKEVIPATPADGMTYDEHKVDVTVTVSDNGNGTLKSVVTYDPDESAALFKNISKFRNSTSGNLEVSKILEVADEAADEIKNTEFSFTVELTDSEDKPLSGKYDYTVYNANGTKN